MTADPMNPFRVIADVSHTLSKCILIWAIHSNRSAEGVSLITQVLYAVVFCTRYMDLFWSHPFSGTAHWFLHVWNFFLKIFYISTSLYILFMMLRVYGRTHERDRAWRLGAICLGGSLLAAPFAMLAMDGRNLWSFWQYLWDFSLILESVCVLPQLLLLRQTTIPTVIDSFYLLTLGSYRGFYVLNWIVRRAQGDHPHLVAVVSGVIQTALYIDFAWVYWGRQRVKLRNGALVDSDDFRRGWLISKILGPPTGGGAAPLDSESPEGARQAEDGSAGPVHDTWGPRGISVSADEHPPTPQRAANGERKAPQQYTDVQRKRQNDSAAAPEETARILHDSDEDSDVDDMDAPPPPPGGVGNGSEWREPR